MLALSVDGVLEPFTWAELWHIRFLDFDHSTGTRVTSGTGCTLANGKGAKTDQGHGAALFQGGAHRTDQRIERAARSRFRNVSLFGDVLDQFVLVHYGPLNAELNTPQRNNDTVWASKKERVLDRRRRRLSIEGKHRDGVLIGFN